MITHLLLADKLGEKKILSFAPSALSIWKQPKLGKLVPTRYSNNYKHVQKGCL